MTENAPHLEAVTDRLARPVAMALLDPGHPAWLERIALRHLADFGDVIELPELVSVGFLALRRAAERYDPSRGVPFRAFAFSRVDGAMMREIGHRLAWVTRRRRRRSSGIAEEGEVASMAPRRTGALGQTAETNTPERLLEARRDRMLLRRALAELDGEEQAVLCARYIDGMRLVEIAEWLGVSYATVRRRHQRGLDALRLILTSRGRAKRSKRSSRAVRSRCEPPSPHD